MAEELRRAIVQAHRVGSAKAEFLARMSHEIRTPLNAIIGYGQILREEAEESDDQLLLEDVDRILEAAHYLMRLINMILDLAKIGAGRMRFDIHPHDLGDLLEASVDAHREAIAANGNRTIIEIAPDLGAVEVDRPRLLQILGCIVENAARHTEGGTITIRAGRGLDSGPQRAFTIAVSDTGVGIKPDAMASLFDRFAASRTAADGRYGGTGLSLTVCSQLCRAMGGSIAVASTLGEGSTFTVRLPEAPAERHDLAPAPATAAAA